jgi:hypothetical protein
MEFDEEHKRHLESVDWTNARLATMSAYSDRMQNSNGLSRYGSFLTVCGLAIKTLVELTLYSPWLLSSKHTMAQYSRANLEQDAQLQEQGFDQN